jgi:hypothetical protein
MNRAIVRSISYTRWPNDCNVYFKQTFDRVRHATPRTSTSTNLRQFAAERTAGGPVFQPVAPTREPCKNRLVPARLGTALVYALVGAFALASLALPWSRALQREAMAAHQLRPRSLPRWVALQLWPKMYGLAHRVFVSERPLSVRVVATEPPPADVESAWVNHYPARYLRFDTRRRELVAAGTELHLLLRSSYRGLEESTAYTVHGEGDRLVVERAQ